MESSIPSSKVITNERDAIQFLNLLASQNPLIILEQDPRYSPSSLLQENLLDKFSVYSASSFPQSSSSEFIVIVSPLNYPLNVASMAEIKRSILIHSRAAVVEIVFVIDAWTKMWAKGLSQNVIEILNPNVLIVGSSLDQVGILAGTLQLDEAAFNAPSEEDPIFAMQHRVAKNLAPGLHKPFYRS